MTSISQIIPNYATGGISDQPDELKKPGQLRKCVNAYPDLIHGLYRRPGFELLGTLTQIHALTIMLIKGTWFPFVRQNPSTGNQENFLFNINKAGEVRAYDIEGNSVDVYYKDRPIDVKKLIDIGDQFRAPGDNPKPKEIIDISEANTCLQEDYFEHKFNDALRTVAINDFIVVCNPEKEVRMGRDSEPRPYEAFIDITVLDVTRDYDLGITIGDGGLPNDSYTRVTGINLIDTERFPKDPNDTGDCPAIFNQTLTLDSSFVQGTNTSGRSGLEIEFNTRGRQKQSDGDEYYCRYSHTVNLIDGGRGWQVGDIVKVFRYGANSGADRTSQANGTDPFYLIEITEVEKVRTPYDIAITGVNLSNSTNKDISELLSLLRQALVNATKTDSNGNVLFDPFTAAQVKKRGNGIYITSNEPFSISTSEKDLMNILSPTEEEEDNPYAVVNNVSKLPIECVNGFVAKVANSFTDEDDYWVQFITDHGDIDKASVGHWEEIAEPNTDTRLNSGSMPHVIMFANADSGVTLNNSASEIKNDTFIVAPVRWKNVPVEQKILILVL